MTHHNNKPNNNEVRTSSQAKQKAWGHLEELHGIISREMQGDKASKKDVKSFNRVLEIVEDIQRLRPEFENTLTKDQRADLDTLAQSFADYSSEGSHRRESYAKDFADRKQTVDQSLMNLLQNRNAA